jgi:gamma-glutamyltranspeptidase/glutathione hydrolase
MAVLERGGNAFDAAVAAGFVLQVVEPHLNGPGGEVPILAAPAGAGRVLVVNGQGPVPAAATIGRFTELGLDLIPGTGLLPACVPGAFGAWMLLLRDHGTLAPRDVLEPAIGYAEAGFPAVPRIGAAIGAVASLFRDEWPSSAEVWLAGGVPAPGGRLRNPALAATWRRLLDEAEAASADRDGQIEAALATFYEGFVAGTTSTAGGQESRRRWRSTTTAGRSARPAPGARARSSSSSCACWRGSTWSGWASPAPPGSTR